MDQNLGTVNLKDIYCQTVHCYTNKTDKKLPEVTTYM